ncbi:MCE family protein [Tsukamurella tyrosinosolvens]|uniref:MCE family protein n=1 Tax=Tsukamurella tyrosinosolvens TaxID=57704 RepID=UPI00079B2467|nr:MlaD family protein [Tsukamurella tyrosinosolvens]AUN41482.1 mammalian cell entry protein [Tsukamurella tyrosinosolvens]KXP04816.1 mammalian cell entry protein [Tsukamurella tyrosinosolvens]KZL98070.1 mammalian cell entry protein [Tsukamurella tyrosinosolvens]MCA4995272.1 MCE family protein [Tsukamurella tyrosinosolvens]QRY84246.1 MCE family protein [Tsukamurella tyrosinosolvens]
MIPRLQRRQLLVFAVLAVVGIAFVGAQYARIDKMLGFGVYTVKVMLKDSGGIFTNAEVTYRGTPVGRVGQLHLIPDGVQVDLQLDKSRPSVPDDVQAVVAERSSIGEQYLDLVPKKLPEGGIPSKTVLADGAVIRDTRVQEPIEDFLKHVTVLSESVDPAKLKTVVTELSVALGGNGQNLRALVESLSRLAQTGSDTLDPTLSLITNGRTALATQAEQSSAIRQWADSLQVVTATLANSDPDLRRLLQTGNLSAAQLSALVQQSGGDVTKVVHDLAAQLTAVDPVAPNLKQILILFPMIASGAFATSPGDGLLHYGVVLEVNNPPACTVGYESTQKMIDAIKKQNPDFDISRDPFPFNTQVGCDVPQGNPTGVRSADRARYADPRVPQPWDGKPKVIAPDRLDLGPVAQAAATILGGHPK